MIFKNRDRFILFDKKQYKNLIQKRENEKNKPFIVYGSVFIISTKTIKNTLFILENIIPMTFFILSILGSIFYKKVGYIEFMRIDKRNFYNGLKKLLIFKS